MKTFPQFLQEKEKDTYTFEELPAESQKKAIEKNDDINVDYNWWEDSINLFCEDMWELYGVDVESKDVQFTGFYSQGDGASFTGEVEDEKKFIEKALMRGDDEYLDMGTRKAHEKEFDDLLNDLGSLGYDMRERLKPEDIYIEFRRDPGSRYSHENTVYSDVLVQTTPSSWNDDEEFNWTKYSYWWKDLETDCTNWLRGQCVKLYRQLKDEYDELRSEEVIKDPLIANDYEFDLEGNIVS
jgi:hypothetical protein